MLVRKKITDLVSEKWAGFAETVNADPILFGDYKNALKEGEAQLYEDLGNFTLIKKTFEEVRENTPINTTIINNILRT